MPSDNRISLNVHDHMITSSPNALAMRSAFQLCLTYALFLVNYYQAVITQEDGNTPEDIKNIIISTVVANAFLFGLTASDIAMKKSTSKGESGFTNLHRSHRWDLAIILANIPAALALGLCTKFIANSASKMAMSISVYLIALLAHGYHTYHRYHDAKERMADIGNSHQMENLMTGEEEDSTRETSNHQCEVSLNCPCFSFWYQSEIHAQNNPEESLTRTNTPGVIQTPASSG